MYRSVVDKCINGATEASPAAVMQLIDCHAEL